MKGFSISLLESEADSRTAIVFGNIERNMSRDLLSMLVENVSGLDESKYSLEIIWEASAAVATFNVPAGQKGNTQPQWLQITQRKHASWNICWCCADVQKFRSSQRLLSQGLTARPLEAALSVRVEELPPSVVGGTSKQTQQTQLFNLLYCKVAVSPLSSCWKMKNTLTAVLLLALSSLSFMLLWTKHCYFS